MSKPHSLFHEATFKESVAAGTASPAVLLSMMGMSARYEHARVDLFRDSGRAEK